MAHVEYAFPVEVIHGKVAKRHKIGFAHRKASKLNYTQSYSKRSTKYSQAEKDHQAKFAAVAAMVNARLADPNQMPLDQLAFKGQSKYKTLRQYVWHICSEEYDKQNAWGGNIGDFFEPDVEQNFGEEIETDRDPDL